MRPDLWAKRPLIPTKEDVAHFNLLMKWEEAVDYYAELQREIKCMAAWCSMADSIIAYSKDCPLVDKVLPANETLIGMWMNGCNEEDGKWLLASRAPCFIIHELTAQESREWVAGSKCVGDFHTGMGAIAKKNGNVLLELNWELGERSSIVAQGWKNGVHCDPRKVVIVDSPTSKPVSPIDPGIRLPPPITCAIGLGGWSKWTEEELENEERVLLRRGKNYTIPTDSYVYFNQINNRCVYMESPLPMPSNYKANPWLFGLPVPFLNCVELEGHKKYGTRKRTTWVYFDLQPEEDNVGRCYDLERADDQYDGRTLPGFESESEDEWELHGDEEKDDDSDRVSIPEDDYGQGIYSNNPMTSVNNPLQEKEFTYRHKSLLLNPTPNSPRTSNPMPARRSLSPSLSPQRSAPRLRSPSPRRSVHRRRSPSPQLSYR
ncbi:hypothetical protein CPC08DRAFT_801854, partial [Agrocybe pediades]